MKTQWRKMESWRPRPTIGACPALGATDIHIVSREYAPGYFFHKTDRRRDIRFFKTRAAALRAANAANRRDGLPEVT